MSLNPFSSESSQMPFSEKTGGFVFGNSFLPNNILNRARCSQYLLVKKILKFFQLFSES